MRIVRDIRVSGGQSGIAQSCLVKIDANPKGFILR
jgi:hypothetical protein